MYLTMVFSDDIGLIDVYLKGESVVEDIKKDEELGGVFMTLEEKMNELAKEMMEEGKALGIKEGIKLAVYCTYGIVTVIVSVICV